MRVATLSAPALPPRGLPIRTIRLRLVPAAVLAALALVLTTALPAVADEPPAPVHLSSKALPTVQVNGVVWAQAIAKSTVYVGGNFTVATPIKGKKVKRANVLAYDLKSGELKRAFSANTNGPVTAVAVSPDRRTVYIGGNFTKVRGTTRRYLAALSATSGKPTGFRPVVNSLVSGVQAIGKKVYVVGRMTRANTTTVHRAAAFSTSGKTLGWHPVLGPGTVYALTVTPDGRTAVVGGQFRSANGQSAVGFAPTDATTGALKPWGANQVLHVGGTNQGIWALGSDRDTVYASAFTQGATEDQQAFEGVAAIDSTTGGLRWLEDCHGDSYGAVSMSGVVYVANHAHYCGNVPGGYGELGETHARRALAFSKQVAGTLGTNTVQGPSIYSDFGGTPSPRLEGFAPVLTAGTFTGQLQAAWTVAAGSGYVLYGGEFPKVNGKTQHGLTRFREPTG